MQGKCYKNKYVGNLKKLKNLYFIYFIFENIQLWLKLNYNKANGSTQPW